MYSQFQMRSRQKLTNIDKRRLMYDPYDRSKLTTSNKYILQLPPEFEKKISPAEYKKLKQAFFIEANQEMRINKQKFSVVMRSLGIVLNTYEFCRIFQQLQEKQMTWKEFLMAYIAKRGFKGSYNQLSHAVYDLSREYRGDWDQLIGDLQKLGDVLSQQQVEILQKDILKGATITSQSLINGLLYEK